MDKQTLEQAAEDISMIKQVIERTSNSFITFGQIFICWGVLLIISNLIGFIAYYNFYSISTSPFLILISQVLFFSIGVVIYFRNSRKIPLIGLSRQLMTLWLCIIAFSILIMCISSILVSVFNAPFYDYYASIQMTFAFGFICTSIFTRLKLPAFLALFYVIVTIVFMQFASFLPYSISLKIPILSALLLPIGLLSMGSYLEFIRIRRN
ncbi:MAG TPA: hypothetical protein VIK78_09385 [Ruminiclostridium sp.]